MRRILVTGGGGSAASNFVRSLRLADTAYHVTAVDVSPYHLELCPADRRYLVPEASDPTYLDELNEICEREGCEVVHAQPDVEVLTISEHRNRLSAATFLPRHETIVVCQDKALSGERIAAAGLPAPLFATANTEGDLLGAADSIVETHGRAWVRASRGAGSRAALPVSSGEQAVAWARYWIQERGLSWTDFMVSEFLPGRELAFQSLWLDGELVTSAVRERVEYLYGHLSPSGQSSTPSVARTVHRPDVNELAHAAIRTIDPEATGIFCVDLKEDATGRAVITEINAGRFFTTSNFLAQAGANMPDLYLSLALGEPPTISLSRFDAVEPGIWWVRMVDMGSALVRNDEWAATRSLGRYP